MKNSFPKRDKQQSKYQCCYANDKFGDHVLEKISCIYLRIRQKMKAIELYMVCTDVTISGSVAIVVMTRTNRVLPSICAKPNTLFICKMQTGQ